MIVTLGSDRKKATKTENQRYSNRRTHRALRYPTRVTRLATTRQDSKQARANRDGSER